MEYVERRKKNRVIIYILFLCVGLIIYQSWRLSTYEHRVANLMNILSKTQARNTELYENLQRTREQVAKQIKLIYDVTTSHVKIWDHNATTHGK